MNNLFCPEAFYYVEAEGLQNHLHYVHCSASSESSFSSLTPYFSFFFFFLILMALGQSCGLQVRKPHFGVQLCHSQWNEQSPQFFELQFLPL